MIYNEEKIVVLPILFNTVRSRRQTATPIVKGLKDKSLAIVIYKQKNIHLESTTLCNNINITSLNFLQIK